MYIKSFIEWISISEYAVMKENGFYLSLFQLYINYNLYIWNGTNGRALKISTLNHNPQIYLLVVILYNLI